MPEIKCERDKYLWIYGEDSMSWYGKRNHGSDARQLILDMKPDSILDVGCGRGQFVEWAKSKGIKSVGMDFASGYGIQADLLDMPFSDESFEMITAFDILEHLLPEDLEQGLSEMFRVARKWWVLSIGYGSRGIETPYGFMKLHLISTKDRNWWIPRLFKYAKIKKKGITKGKSKDPYIFCELNK